MADETPPLNFDRADYGGASGEGPPCGRCGGALGIEYWKWQSQLMCGSCRARTEAEVATLRGQASFGKAVLLGGGTMVATGLAYAVLVALSGIQLAFATIGIAYVIAKVVRGASGGLSGRKFQVLAVALTYVASAMGYAPGVAKGIGRSDPPHGQEVASVTAGGSAGSSASPESPEVGIAGNTPAPADDTARGRSGLSFFVLLRFALMFLGITLAAPFLSASDAPIGVLIVLFGLWEAWKLTRPVVVAMEGPFRLAPRATPETP